MTQKGSWGLQQKKHHVLSAADHRQEGGELEALSIANSVIEAVCGIFAGVR